jgi:hypothetical protein
MFLINDKSQESKITNQLEESLEKNENISIQI